jgi:pimeloyl-ACP methyl ester carboxylesterase
MAGAAPPGFVELQCDGLALRIEHRWLGIDRTGQPLMVFLHEGLGSLAMWKDFPQRLVDALGWRGLVYSRPGYGRSTPCAPGEAWTPQFMHHQAQRVLPALLAALGVSEPVFLLGHSDGASIALLHAAAFPDRVLGAVVMAPHILVEDLTIAGIERARDAFADGDLRTRLAPYHDDPDATFRGWNDIWLHPDFRGWSIDAELQAIRCPLLAIQGTDDAYGTMAQVHGIAQRVPGTTVLALPQCGHSPHREQPERVINAVQAFVHGLWHP